MRVTTDELFLCADVSVNVYGMGIEYESGQISKILGEFSIAVRWLRLWGCLSCS